MATHVLNLEFQLMLGSLGGTLMLLLDVAIVNCSIFITYLEGQVLEKVSGTVGLVRLSTGAGIDPHTNSRGLGPGGVIGGNLERGISR